MTDTIKLTCPACDGEGYPHTLQHAFGYESQPDYKRERCKRCQGDGHIVYAVDELSEIVSMDYARDLELQRLRFRGSNEHVAKLVERVDDLGVKLSEREKECCRLRAQLHELEMENRMLRRERAGMVAK